MAISKIKLPDNSVQDLHDARGVDTNGSFYYVDGSSSAAGDSTSGQYLSTKWEGTVPGVSAAYNGLKIAYRIATRTGVSGGGVVLSIDNGAHYYPVVIQKNTMVTTHYPVGATFLAVFNSTQTATAYLTAGTKSTVTGCWQIMEYDSNTNTYQREYVSTGDTEYPVTARYNTTTGETYYAEYGRYSEGVTLNPSKNSLTASEFIVANGTSSQFLKADGSVDSSTYLTSFTETDPVFGASPAAGIQSSDITAWNAKYDKPSGGIPSTDMASAVQTSLGKADSAYQKPSSGIPSSDLASPVRLSLSLADTAYQKPGTGIPLSDMATEVQTSLGKADTAYQKPSGGIPASDLASGVIPTVPTISTDISADASSDVKTASPKAVKTYVDSAIPTVPVQDVTVGGTSVVSSGTAAIPAIPDAVEANPTIPSGTTPTALSGLKIGSSYYSVSSGGSAGTLNTTATTAQSTNASESLGGTVVLHKIAKTGTYSDLIGAPTMEALTTSEIDTIWTNAA